MDGKLILQTDKRLTIYHICKLFTSLRSVSLCLDAWGTLTSPADTISLPRPTMGSFASVADRLRLPFSGSDISPSRHSLALESRFHPVIRSNHLKPTPTALHCRYIRTLCVVSWRQRVPCVWGCEPRPVTKRPFLMSWTWKQAGIFFDFHFLNISPFLQSYKCAANMTIKFK